MKERIRQIMEAENMTPARFADTLNIGRAVISHILNGRNNPSLDVIMRILDKMPDISSDWLLSGSGSMYRNENMVHDHQGNIYPDLFSQISDENPVNTDERSEETKYRKEDEVNASQNIAQNIVNERIIIKESPAKKIKQIIIYYTDNTFETFSPD